MVYIAYWHIQRRRRAKRRETFLAPDRARELRSSAARATLGVTETEPVIGSRRIKDTKRPRIVKERASAPLLGSAQRVR